MAVVNTGDLGPRNISNVWRHFLWPKLRGRCYYYLMGRGQDVAKNSAMHRRGSHNKELSNPNVNRDEVEKHFYKVFVVGNRPHTTVGAY